jgi:hypothetical protein
MGALPQVNGNVLPFPKLDQPGAEGHDVERINQYALYRIGRVFQQLRRIEDVDATDAYSPLTAARRVIIGLKQGTPLPLGISEQPANDLLSALESIIDWNYYERDGKGNVVIDEKGRKKRVFPEKGQLTIEVWEWSTINAALDRFETVFAEEMRDAATYYVPRRGIFSTKHLVDAADESFPKELSAVIPQKTKDDWKSAGRCLAFSLLSASGFHVARAVEGTIEVFSRSSSRK